MRTLQVDSRFVNGAVYVIFDVIVSFVLMSAIQVCYALLIEKRLRNGRRIRLRETTLGSVAGVVSDGGLLSFIFTIISFSLLVTFFLLTLGINGRSEFRVRPVTRRYITRLAANRDDYNRKRLRPQYFSACREQKGNVLQYFPTAFDTVANKTLDDRFAFHDEHGQSVNINASTALCQKHGSFDPMLVVPKCGENLEQCSNVQIQNASAIHLLPVTNDGSNDWQRSFVLFVGNDGINGSGGRLIVMYRNVKVIEDEGNSPLQTYRRAICKERPLQGEENWAGNVYFNCVIGFWNENGTQFTFQLGEMSFERINANLQGVISVESLVKSQFQSATAEVEVEWDAGRHGEVLFADALSSLTHKVTAASYLDSIISRAVVADKLSSDRVVFEQVSVNVTDVNSLAEVAYISLVAVTIAISAWRVLLNRMQASRRMAAITSYSGVCELLRCKCGISTVACGDQKWTSFEASKAGDNGSFAISVVHQDPC